MKNNDIRVNMENLSKDERELLLKLIEKANSITPFNVDVGNTFKIADIEFIRFPSRIDGGIPIIAKDIVFNAEFDENINNFAESNILKRLQIEILPKIEAVIGADNILKFETDLLALNGTDGYGRMKSKISLPTFDFYRQNYKIFIKYDPRNWWWLATANSTINSAVCRVDCDGAVCGSSCYCSGGVRPFLILKSNIFKS